MLQQAPKSPPAGAVEHAAVGRHGGAGAHRCEVLEEGGELRAEPGRAAVRRLAAAGRHSHPPSQRWSVTVLNWSGCGGVSYHRPQSQRPQGLGWHVLPARGLQTAVKGQPSRASARRGEGSCRDARGHVPVPGDSGGLASDLIERFDWLRLHDLRSIEQGRFVAQSVCPWRVCISLHCRTKGD